MKRKRGTDWIKYEQAKKILGETFIGPVEVEELCSSLRYDPKAIKALLKALPPPEKLLEIRDNDWILTVGPPKKMAIHRMMELFPILFSMNSHSYRNISNQRFSKEERIGPEWIILSKNPVADSGKKDFQQQQKMLVPGKEMVPTIAELSWNTMIQCLANSGNGVSFSVRTSSRDSKFGCACLAVMENKIQFFSYDNKGRHPEVGIFKKMKD